MPPLEKTSDALASWSLNFFANTRNNRSSFTASKRSYKVENSTRVVSSSFSSDFGSRKVEAPFD